MHNSVARRAPARLVRARPARLVSALFAACLACSATPSSDAPTAPTPTVPPGGAEAGPSPEIPPTPPAVVFPKTSQREHTAGSAWAFDPGAAPRKLEIGAAEAAGYTVI